MKNRLESFTPSNGSVIEYSSLETEIYCAKSLILVRKMRPNLRLWKAVMRKNDFRQSACEFLNVSNSL